MDAICTYDHIRIANSTIGKGQPRSDFRFIDGNTSMPESNRCFQGPVQHVKDFDPVDLITLHCGSSSGLRNRHSP